MKKVTIYFDEDHTISADVSEDEAQKIIDWFYGSETVYKLVTSIRTYYISKNHIRHISVTE